MLLDPRVALKLPVQPRIDLLPLLALPILLRHAQHLTQSDGVLFIYDLSSQSPSFQTLMTLSTDNCVFHESLSLRLHRQCFLKYFLDG